MIDWLIRQMFKIPALRINIFQEVDMYNSISRIMADDDSSKIACAIWCEEDGWRGWHIKEDGSYYFHDIAEHSLGDIMQLVTSEPEEKEQTVGYGYDELKDFDMGYRGREYKIITPFLGENR